MSVEGRLLFLRLCCEKRLIAQEQAEAAQAEAQRLGLSPAAVLIRRGLISEQVAAAIRREVEQALEPTSIGGFRIIERLGQGAMGTVYRAEQVSLGREVALKVMAPQIARDPESAERFLREARVAATINHPNVIGVIDVGNDGGVLYMALELVAGGDAARLAQRFAGTLPEVRALEIVRDCALGLQAIYEARLVHRDIKPANIFIGRHGDAKLADLGLARSESGADRMTTTGITVGTPAFMSPEQASGGEVDIRTDIYALGATLFTLVTGSTPFTGAGPFAVVAKVIHDPAPDARARNRELSAATAAVIATAIAKRPEQRFQTPLELLTALEAALGQAPRPTATLQKRRSDSALPAAGGAAAPGVPPTTVRTLAPQRNAAKTSGARRSRMAMGIGTAVATAVGALVVVGTIVLLRGPHGQPGHPAGTAAGAPPTPAASSTSARNTAPPVEPSASDPAVVAASVPAITGDPRPAVAASAIRKPPEKDRPAWASASGADRFGVWCELTVDTVTQRLRRLPAGTFLMGARPVTAKSVDIEPRHLVTLTRGFWLADSECTQALWRTVMGGNPSRVVGQDHPVEQVSWDECQVFFARLAARIPGLKPRLPTNAEWEYACRAGTDAIYWFGDDPEQLVLYDNVADARFHAANGAAQSVHGDDGFLDTAPVKGYPPNPFGLYDLHGNVAEWNQDSGLVGGTVAQTDPVAVGGPYRNMSGGSFASDSGSCRASIHPALPTHAHDSGIGFRFAITDDR
jgi:formylglycine-generating enzyme required for sulfatase activity